MFAGFWLCALVKEKSRVTLQKTGDLSFMLSDLVFIKTQPLSNMDPIKATIYY